MSKWCASDVIFRWKENSKDEQSCTWQDRSATSRTYDTNPAETFTVTGERKTEYVSQYRKVINEVRDQYDDNTYDRI